MFTTDSHVNDTVGSSMQVLSTPCISPPLVKPCTHTAFTWHTLTTCGTILFLTTDSEDDPDDEVFSSLRSALIRALIQSFLAFSILCPACSKFIPIQIKLDSQCHLWQDLHRPYQTLQESTYLNLVVLKQSLVHAKEECAQVTFCVPELYYDGQRMQCAGPADFDWLVLADGL